MEDMWFMYYGIPMYCSSVLDAIILMAMGKIGKQINKSNISLSCSHYVPNKTNVCLMVCVDLNGTMWGNYMLTAVENKDKEAIE